MIIFQNAGLIDLRAVKTVGLMFLLGSFERRRREEEQNQFAGDDIPF